MPQKTAVQQIIDRLYDNKAKSENVNYEHLYSDIAINICTQLLETEKKQIVDAFKEAITLEGSDEWKQEEAETYYSDTFQS